MSGRCWRRDVLKYTVAIVSVLLALAIQQTLGTHWVGTEPLFYAAVIVSAYVGGLGPGLVATALAAFCTAYFFFEPAGSATSRLIEGSYLVRGLDLCRVTF